MGSAVRVQAAQQGAALLLTLLVAIVGSAALLTSRLNQHLVRANQDQATSAALSAAKEALLDYALTYGDLNGTGDLPLPCPDIDGSGGYAAGVSHDTNCGVAGETVIGRFPWKTLGVQPYRDATGACLWYAVSGTYKNAITASSRMINPDTNGQLQLLDAGSGIILHGGDAHSRAVALIFAPMRTLPGQSRQPASSTLAACSDDFTASAYLDTVATLGVSNASLAPGIAVNQFVHSSVPGSDANDRVQVVTRRELEESIYSRSDFTVRIHRLAEAAARCVAVYGQSNPGGPDDRRLPWPAPASLADYTADSAYVDLAGAALSGRLPDTVTSSSSATGNPIARVLNDCSAVDVPGWTAENRKLWSNWKDHFFYYVAEAFSPGGSIPSACGNCLTVDGAGPVAAVLIFANRRLAGAGQLRTVPPLDIDTKMRVENYLEGRNSSSHPYTGGMADLESGAAAANFNDILYCIDTSLAVSPC